jgi:hypothetical protein
VSIDVGGLTIHHISSTHVYRIAYKISRSAYQSDSFRQEIDVVVNGRSPSDSMHACRGLPIFYSLAQLCSLWPGSPANSVVAVDGLKVDWWAVCSTLTSLLCIVLSMSIDARRTA